MPRIDEKKRMQMTFEIGLHRYHNSHTHPDQYHLVITDQTSRIMLLECELDVEQFADLLSNRDIKAQGVFFNSDKYGKELHVSRVMLKLPKRSHDINDVRKAAAKWDKANKPWKIREYDLKVWNGHNHSGDTYRVIAEKWGDDGK